MVQKTLAGKNVEVNDEGYMTTPSEWSRDIATALATEIGITLTDKHWEVLEYLRKSFNEGVALSLRKVGNSGIVDIKGLYSLFPGGPLKKSALIAGIPKPASCV